MKPLLICASAPCVTTELAALDLSEWDICAVNRGNWEIPADVEVKYLATLHAEDYQYFRRGRICTPVIDYPYDPLPNALYPSRVMGTTGTSTLLAVLFGIEQGYGAIRIIGAPLEDEKYHGYRRGWEAMETILRGRSIESCCGWTKKFLEKSCKPIALKYTLNRQSSQ